MKKVSISPSILSANFSNLEKDIKKLEKYGASYLHYDIMDGHFVNNISFGVSIVKSISNKHNLINDVHLMIENPLKYAESFIDAGADILTFHLEATKKDDTKKLIQLIKNKNCKVGISIKPKTNIKEIIPFLKDIDLVLVMSVEPGFSGQSFINNSIDKIKSLRNYIDKENINCLIEVDGGINDITGKQCKDAGADILVSGSYLFGHKDIKDRIRKLL